MCHFIKKQFKLPFLKHETYAYYDVEFYLPFDGDEKIDFTHKISQENNSICIFFKFPGPPVDIPYGVVEMEIFEDSETIIQFDSKISSKSDIIIKDKGDYNLIIIRVLKDIQSL